MTRATTCDAGIQAIPDNPELTAPPNAPKAEILSKTSGADPHELAIP